MPLRHDDIGPAMMDLQTSDMGPHAAKKAALLMAKVGVRLIGAIDDLQEKIGDVGSEVKEAIETSSSGAERQAHALTRATYVLALVTFALVLATLIPPFIKH